MKPFTLPFLKAFVLLLLSIAISSALALDKEVEDKAKQIWQMLDYMGVDYSGAVKDGQIISKEEYAEMMEFSQTVERQLRALPDTAQKKELLQSAGELKQAIAGKAPPASVSDQARKMAAVLLAAYPIPANPSGVPDLNRGASIYAAQCASCHGVTGKADGPLAAKLNPPPIAFTDSERARERSVFSLYQTTSRGVEGTSMPSFATMSDDDRWAVAFFASTLSYAKEEMQQGAQLWKNDPAVRKAMPNIGAVVQSSEAELARELDPTIARKVLAFLRSSPDAMKATQGDSLSLSKQRLGQSLAAAEQGDRDKASKLAISAYLDGFEPVEPALAAKNKPLLDKIERTMGIYRSSLAEGNLVQAKGAEGELQSLLDEAQNVLNAANDDPWAAFLGALMILLREGLEALLVVIAIIAFLKKADRRDALPYVHAGWVGALAAGGLTWVAATYLVDISGASREITEGFAAIFAAIVLLTVGVWMHQKSMAGRWQAYIRDKLSSALNKRSLTFLFILSFVTVYREVFETVLFYAALWTGKNGMYLLAGLVTGVVILALLAFVMLRTSARLPIGKFFAFSSGLVAILSVVLIGKGVAALQEAGWLGVTPLAIPKIDLLGIYPSQQTVLAQAVIVLIIVLSYGYNLRSQKS
jgi:high-affinity iron transporter